MAPPPQRHAPTTLKKAKKAYQKASAIPHLSEAELARIKRLEELEEKHERMRERERKRLLNKKKREEKIAKEKEIRKNMGLPEPGAPYIGPSQVRISQFIKGGKKVASNQASKQEKDKQDEDDDEEMPLSELDEEVLAALASPVSERSKTPRKPLECLDGNRSLSQDMRGRDSSPDTAVGADDDWESMLVSNTQIQRELFTDDDDDEEEAVQEDTSAVALRTTALPDPPAAKEADDTADLLALISTQDLEDEEDSNQSVLSASTQYPEFAEEELRELELPEHPVLASTQYPGFTDEELRDLDMSEPSASATPVHSGPQRAAETAQLPAEETNRGGSHLDTERTEFDIDDFELSTQDWRELDA